MMKAEKISERSGKRVLLYFVLFFLMVGLVNAVFIYYAISTHTGVITTQAYEKGLAYNEIIKEAREQEDLNLKEMASYGDGVLRWSILDGHLKPISNVQVIAHMIRPVEGGHDFKIPLQDQGNGIYEAKLETPLKGQWMARLEAKWQKHNYKTVLILDVK